MKGVHIVGPGQELCLGDVYKYLSRVQGQSPGTGSGGLRSPEAEAKCEIRVAYYFYLVRHAPPHPGDLVWCLFRVSGWSMVLEFRVFFWLLFDSGIMPNVHANGGFRRGPSRPPPLGDGLTPSLTVMLANALNFSSCTVKHGTTQNIQNDCRQWLCDSFRLHAPNSFWSGSPSRTPLGETSALPRLPSWFKVSYFYRGGEGNGKGKELNGIIRN